VIVGGGPAGLSSALVLGRARRRVLVLDTGRPANRFSNGIGGLLAQNHVKPAELRAAGREQLTGFPNVDVRDGEVLDVARLGDGFAVKLDGAEVLARSIVLAHGLRYDPPALPGVQGLWGRSVFHCPFCDGWEVRDKRVAVHGHSEEAVRLALRLRTWSDDVVLCADGALPASESALADAGVRVRPEPVVRLDGHRGQLRRLVLDGGGDERADALFVVTRARQPNDLADALGCELDERGVIVCDEWGRTSVPNVLAAGDTATPAGRTVANALGSGSRVAYGLLMAGRRRAGQPTTYGASRARSQSGHSTGRNVAASTQT
jgi:thioredoxin reductase